MSPNPVQKNNQGNTTGRGITPQNAPLNNPSNASKHADVDTPMGEASGSNNKDELEEYTESRIPELEPYSAFASEENLADYLAKGNRIEQKDISAHSPDFLVRAYCQQEADRCSAGMKAALFDDNLFNKLKSEREGWQEKLAQFQAKEPVAAPSTNAAKSQHAEVKDRSEMSLVELVKNLKAFTDGMPPFQLRGHGHRHNKGYGKYATIVDFFEDFEIYLDNHDVPIESHWKACMYYACSIEKRKWCSKLADSKNITCYEDFKRELIEMFSSPYSELYHMLHIRYMTQHKLQLTLRNFAIMMHDYAARHQIEDDKALLIDFLRNMDERYQKVSWDAVRNFRGKHDRFPTMQDMIRLVGGIEDSVKMQKAQDQKLPWADLDGAESSDDDTDSESSDNEGAPTKKRKRTRRSAKKGKGGKPKERSNSHGGKHCTIHGEGNHTTDQCYDVKELAKQKKQQRHQRKEREYGPCKFCGYKNYMPGHNCPQMREYNRLHPLPNDADKRNNNNHHHHKNNNNNFQARMAALRISESKHLQIDTDELMNTPSKHDQCKLEEELCARAMNAENTDSCILLPMLVQNQETMALLDTGCTHSLIDKKYAELNTLPITPANGGTIKLAVEGMDVKRIGYTKDVPVEYNGKHFVHTFEILELPDTDVPIVVGMDILTKMGIGITGLTSAWPNMHASSDNVAETVVDPDPVEPNNSPAGTQEEQDAFHDAIQPLILANKQIPKTSFCTLQESIVSLDTGKHKPVNRRQYPIAHALQPVLAETIDQWLQDGTIEPRPAHEDSSEWNSPITFAPKKDAYGNYTGKRPCLDPRHINRLIPDDRHPLPLIRDIFNSFDGATVFSTLDLKSAFHRFKIRREDRHKTTFTVNGQQYRFKGCPFGLKPISSKFQRVMDRVFKDMRDFVLCFVDDIIVFSRNMEEHKEHVARAIKALTDVNLILNADKCHFAQKAVYLLGFCVSAEGRTLDPRKLTNIHTWPIPQTGKDIQRFLGVVNYFREHVPNISTLTAPLDHLRHVGNLGDLWADVHTEAFIAIRRILVNTPILRYPNMKYPFSVATDASNVGIGAVLYQVIGNETRHISFMARALSKSERNYSTTKRELLAVVYALEKFHQYLWGNHFTLYTDHRALTYLHTQKVANPMMVGWLDRILEYNFEVVHLPGLDNILPDQLSRLFPTAKELEEGNDGDEIVVRAANANSNDMDVQDMFVPPEGERQKLLRQHHLFGHFGASAIVNALHSEGIHWPNMHQDAVETAKKCKECQMFNIAKKGYHPLRPIHAFLPADHWAIDLAGPFRPTFGNNTYLLVMVDICTRYCVLRPIPNKQSDTIVKALIQVFGDYGFPRYLQSDNGTEFVNTLVKKLSEATGFDHRLVTPYHPRANGVAERWVQTSVRTLRKLIKGALKDWDHFVPCVQLAINAKISERHDSAPFSLMFARKMNTFSDYRDEESFRPMTEEELQERLDAMENIVFPAINEKVLAVLDAQKKAFDSKHHIVDFPVDSEVVVVIPAKERTKLDTPHDGPYTVVRKTKGGSYVLKDVRGKILDRDYAPSQLKLISQDYDLDSPCDDLYMVDRIVAHNKIAPGTYEYQVRWEGYTPDDDTWEPESSFTNVQTIHDYWKRLGEKPEQKPEELQSKVKTRKNGSRSKFNSRKRKQQHPKNSVRKSQRLQH